MFPSQEAEIERLRAENQKLREYSDEIFERFYRLWSQTAGEI
jgi:hypothetical protein